MPHVVIAPDTFRGTARAPMIAEAVAEVATGAGWSCDQAPVSDGGEGFCEVMGGARRVAWAHDPLGRRLQAEWRWRDGPGELGDPALGRTRVEGRGRRAGAKGGGRAGVASGPDPGRNGDRADAVVETALASGLELVGGADSNDPVAASTRGTGELIAAAVNAGARRVLIGMGGSATTDGGWGALEVLEPHSRLGGVELVVACDVTTRFLDASAVFAPQKGASPAQVTLLTRRLERLAQLYQDRFGVDVTSLDGSGAAGGLAGGLAAVGATLVPGFEVVADALELDRRVEMADLVVTGEGFVDDQSFRGKAVGGVVALAAQADVPVLVVAGDVDGDQPVPCESLVRRFGRARAMADAPGCVAEIVTERLEQLARTSGRSGGKAG